MIFISLVHYAYTKCKFLPLDCPPYCHISLLVSYFNIFPRFCPISTWWQEPIIWTVKVQKADPPNREPRPYCRIKHWHCLHATPLDKHSRWPGQTPIREAHRNGVTSWKLPWLPTHGNCHVSMVISYCHGNYHITMATCHAMTITAIATARKQPHYFLEKKLQLPNLLWTAFQRLFSYLYAEWTSFFDVTFQQVIFN